MATAIRVAVAVGIWTALAIGLARDGGTAAAPQALEIRIAEVCRVGDLIVQEDGRVRGTFRIAVENAGTRKVRGDLSFGYTYAEARAGKGPLVPIGPIDLRRGEQFAFEAALGEPPYQTSLGLFPDGTLRLVAAVVRTGSSETLADATLDVGPAPAIPPC